MPEPLPDAAPAPDEGAPTPPPEVKEEKPSDDLGDAGKKAIAAERAAAAASEKRAKAAEAELEKLRKASMSDQEKAVSDALEQGRQEATQSVAARIAAAEIRAALTGIVPDPAAIVEDLNLSRYIGEDGEIDSEAVTALAEKFRALGATPKAAQPVPAGSGDNGARGAPNGSQSMTYEQVVALTPQQYAALSPQQHRAARAAIAAGKP